MFRKNHNTGAATCERAVLQGAFWNDDANAVYKKTGQATVTGVYISVPANPAVTGREWTEPDEWAAFADVSERWTLDLKQAQYTRIVKGECAFIFKPGSASEFSQQMAAFDKAFPNAERIKLVNPQLYGTKRFHHIEIRTS
jgi:hypothetical protein